MNKIKDLLFVLVKGLALSACSLFLGWLCYQPSVLAIKWFSDVEYILFFYAMVFVGFLLYVFICAVGEKYAKKLLKLNDWQCLIFAYALPFVFICSINMFEASGTWEDLSNYLVLPVYFGTAGAYRFFGIKSKKK